MSVCMEMERSHVRRGQMLTLKSFSFCWRVFGCGINLLEHGHSVNGAVDMGMEGGGSLTSIQGE